MTPSPDDKVGRILWPGELRRRLGARYVRASEVAQEAGVTEKQAAKTLQMLSESGDLQPWLAPECPECEALWPSFLGEDDIPHQIHCPHCKAVNDRDKFEFFLVYEVLEEPDK